MWPTKRERPALGWGADRPVLKAEANIAQKIFGRLPYRVISSSVGAFGGDAVIGPNQKKPSKLVSAESGV